MLLACAVERDGEAESPASGPAVTSAPVNPDTSQSSGLAAPDPRDLAQDTAIMRLLWSAPELPLADTVLITESDERFSGTPLPHELEIRFERAYPDRESDPDGVLFVSRVTLKSGWSAFVLRVPGMYASEKLHLWMLPPDRARFEAPIEIAEIWGDAGEWYDLRTWILTDSAKHTLILHRCAVVFDIDLENPPPKVTQDSLELWSWSSGGFSAPVAVADRELRARLTGGDHSCMTRFGD